MPDSSKPVTFRDIGDNAATRGLIFDNVLSAARGIQPVSNPRHTLALSNVHYDGPEKFTIADRKKAILSGKSLYRRLRGTWRLSDTNTGQTLDEQTKTLAHVPYMTDAGTFVQDGSECVLANQLRLRAGVYARQKSNGELESHVNVMPGKGLSHRYFLEPETGQFRMLVGQARLPLLPVLRAMGVKDKELRDAWGNEILAANSLKDDPQVINKLYDRMFRYGKATTEDDKRQAVVNELGRMELDPEITQRTLGQTFDKLSAPAILAATKKLIALNRGEAETDNRDDMAFQTVHGPEDLFAERLRLDRGLLKSLLWKASFKGNLQGVGPGVMTPHMRAPLLSSGLGQYAEETNATELLDHQTRITRMGEGGIGSSDAVPADSRDVQASYLNTVDPIRTPESSKVGVENRLSSSVRKGSDGRLYSPYNDLKSGQTVYRSPQDVAYLTVAFPNELKKNQQFVPALVNGKIRYVDRSRVDLEVPSMEGAFSHLSNLVPMKSAVKGQRMAMASRMMTQALPLKNAEAPLVQSGVPGMPGVSFEEHYGKHVGALRADQPGRVVKVTPDFIEVQQQDGTKRQYELFNELPHARKSGIHNTATVQPGDTVAPGQLIATSNHTDANGTIALGLNPRIAFVAHKGTNYEDAITISDSFAKRMQSEHYYQNSVEWEDDHVKGKNAFTGIFPGKFDRKTLEKLDSDGVVKPGTLVNQGDPLILAAQRRTPNQSQVLKSHSPSFSDRTIVWDHSFPGIVTDVTPSRGGVSVAAKAYVPTQEADKLSGRWGNKGVVGAVIPDHEMPVGEDGQPFEVLFNPMGLLSRINPAQAIEMALGKIAAKTGVPYKVEDFKDIDDLTEFARNELLKHGMQSTETVTDPKTGRKIPGVLTGRQFVMKLHHTGESKIQGRGLGSYTSEGVPSKSDADSSKRLALMDTNAILSHGGIDVLRDSGLVRGQKNDHYWQMLMNGFTPPEPKVPFVYEKFVNLMKGAGVSIVRKGSKQHLMAMTDKSIDDLAGDRVLQNAEMVDWNDGLKPIKGGLFDRSMTGSHGGNKWSKIALHEPLPSPVFEDPIRHLLGLTKKQYEAVLTGKADLNEVRGPQAIKQALEQINVPRAIQNARLAINSNKKGARDDAVRRLGYLVALDKQGLKPADWIVSSVPVIPPIFRPVSVMRGGKSQLVSDANALYKELFDANDNLKHMTGRVEDVGTERMAVYNAFKGVTGLGDPISPKNRERGVKGILQQVFGDKPKYGMMQRKLLSSSVNLVGRAVAVPDPNLDIDQVALPEDSAWSVFRPFVIRSLVRRGMNGLAAARAVEERSKPAKDALLEEMDRRPVIADRAPVLHRYGVMALRPQLTAGKAIRMNPFINKGYNLDADGDSCSSFEVLMLRCSAKLVRVLEDTTTLVGESLQMLAANVQLVGKSDDGSAITSCMIKDFPRFDTQFRVTSNGTAIYAVPPGIQVLSFDPNTRQSVFSDVLELSVHPGIDGVEVQTTRGRHVCVSNDHSLYAYDREIDEMVRVTPQESVGMPVPIATRARRRSVIKRIDLTKWRSTSTRAPRPAKQPADFVVADFEFGWWLGASVSDAWADLPHNGTVNYAKTDPSLIAAFTVGCDHLVPGIHAGATKSERHVDMSMGLDAISKKTTYCSVVLAKLFAAWFSSCGSGAKKKHLPPFLLCLPRRCLWGVLTGLIDGDGSLAVNRSSQRKTVGYNVNYCTSSERLKDDVVSLARMLGVRAGVSLDKPKQSWQVNLSRVDLYYHRKRIKLKHADKQRVFAEIPAPAKDHYDVVPVPRELAKSLYRMVVTRDGNPTTLNACIKQGKLITRTIARRWLDYASDAGFMHPQLESWRVLVENTGVHWDVVESLTPIDPQVMYDLTVPETNVFAVNDGLILFDTMNFHAVATDKAVEEAYHKMLPSKNAFSAATFQAHQMPTQEYTAGWYQASTNKSDRPVQVFATARDAVDAYRRGEVDVGQQVKVIKP